MDNHIQSRQTATHVERNQSTSKNSPVSEWELTPEKKALMSAQAYLKPELRHSIFGWEYIPMLSNTKRAVFRSYAPEKKLVFANRGTASKADVKTDVSVAFGNIKKTSRYKRDKRFLQKLRHDLNTAGHNNVKIHGVAHSLGGTLNRGLANERLLDSATNFNAGSGLFDIGKKNKNKNIEEIRTKGDVVSVLSKLSKNKNQTVKPKKKGVLASHSMSNFTGDDNMKAVKFTE